MRCILFCFSLQCTDLSAVNQTVTNLLQFFNTLKMKRQAMYCVYNVTMTRVRVTIVADEKE